MKKLISRMRVLLFGSRHRHARIVFNASLSGVGNVVMAALKIGMGLLASSLFVCVGGLYNIGMALARWAVIRAPDERRGYVRAGGRLLASSGVYMLYCVGMILQGHSNVQYNDIVAIAIATVTTAEIAVAVRGIVTARKDKNLRTEALKLISLSAALISVVLTQTALLSFAYEGGNAVLYSGLAGLLFGGVSVGIGIYMLCRGRKLLPQ